MNKLHDAEIDNDQFFKNISDGKWKIVDNTCYQYHTYWNVGDKKIKLCARDYQKSTDDEIGESPTDEKETIEDVYIPYKGDKKVNDLHSILDANVWAKEMHRYYTQYIIQHFNTHGTVEGLEEFFHSWMCNAIMCGYDHANWKRDKEYTYILKTNIGDILRILHYEPSEKEIRTIYEKALEPDDNHYNIYHYVKLYRWSRDSDEITVWNGTKSDTQYDWKNN